MLGKEYLIDLAISINKENQKSEAFNRYNSEVLRTLNNNVAGALGGTSISKSFQEVIDYKPETRTATEIKSEIKNKIAALRG